MLLNSTAQSVFHLFSALVFAARSAFSFPVRPGWLGIYWSVMGYRSSPILWYTKPPKTRFSWDLGKRDCAIALSTFCELQKIVIGLFLILAAFLAMSKASEIARGLCQVSPCFFSRRYFFLSTDRPFCLSNKRQPQHGFDQVWIHPSIKLRLSSLFYLLQVLLSYTW